MSSTKAVRERYGLREPAMDSLIQDIRHSARSLRRQRGFALVAVISLSVGIGVNTAIFSVFDSL